MLDITDSINKLSWTIEHHHAHILNKHDFMRAWAVQFELAYTDFRTIQMALQLSGDENKKLLQDFTAAYDEVYKYEYEFAAKGLDGFYEKYANDLADYTDAKDKALELLKEISKVQAK